MEVTLIDGTTKVLNLSPATKHHFEDPRNCISHMKAQIDNNYFEGIVTERDKVILDIGANVGLFALHFSPYAERIICVEPTPWFVDIQKEILEGEIYEYAEYALSSFTGSVYFNLCTHNSTMNSLEPREGAAFPVKCLTLNDLCKKYSLTKVDFCKIDIEGSEWVAITEETLKPVFNIINKIFVEVHPPERRTELKKVFEAVGYKVGYCKHDGLLCTK
jgi:FkbM family methyltransferase